MAGEQRDLQAHQQVWDQAGKDDPLWSVLSVPGMQGRWKADEFFETGVREIAEVMRYLERQGIAVEKGRALDFGCGVGRLSQALASHFQASERPRRSVPDHPNELNVAAESPMVTVVIDAQHEPVLWGIGAGPERVLRRRQHEPAPKIRSLVRSAAPEFCRCPSESRIVVIRR